MEGPVGRIAAFVRRHPWVLLSLVSAVVVAVVLSWPPIGGVLLSAYALLNSCGVAMYCDGLRDRRGSLQLLLKLLAVVLVPVGMVTALFSPGGVTPSQASTSGSPDESVRRASIRAPAGGWRGRG